MPVTPPTVRFVPAVITVRLASRAYGKVCQEVTATRDHPFWVVGKGFVPAGELTLGTGSQHEMGMSWW